MPAASQSTPRLLLALLLCRSLGTTGTAYLDLPEGWGVDSEWVVFVGQVRSASCG